MQGTLNEKENSIKDLNSNLNQTKVLLTEKGNKLSETEKLLSQARTELKSKDESITSLKSQLSTERQENVSLTMKVRKIMCSSNTISKNEIVLASTNQGLVNPITRFVEAAWGFSSTNTWFDTLWSNSKTAIFDVQGPDKATVKVVVSWNRDTSVIKGIYDIGLTCFYFFP